MTQELYLKHKKRTIPLLGKIPLDKDWVNTPYKNEEITGNFGWALDSTDLILDVDPRNGGFESLDKLSQDLGFDFDSEARMKVISGSGGVHLYYKKDPNQAVRKKLSEYPGIDFLSFGSQVVGAGSIHPETGQTYELDMLSTTFDDIQWAPKGLMDKLTRSEDYSWAQGLDEYDDHPTNVGRFVAYLDGLGPCEDRDDVSTYHIACRAKDLGLSPKKCLACMLNWDKHNNPPWGEATIRFKIGNAYRYGKNPLGSDNPSTVFDDVDEEEDLFDAELAELMGPEEEIETPQSAYSTHAPTNARVFLARKYPNETLRCRHGDIYAFDGRVWSRVTKEELASQVHLDMEFTTLGQHTINSTTKALNNKVHGMKFVIDPSKIAFQNGVLDLSDPKFPTMCEFSQDYHIVGMHNYDFDPEANCPRWERFLEEVFDCDGERIRLLQEWFGYNLIFDSRFQKIMLMIGVSRSGKGTITRILKSVVGDGMFSGISLTTLTESFGLATLLGKKSAVIADAHNAPQGKQNRAKELLLNISGNDTVMVNRKFMDQLSIQLKTKVTMVANEVPSFSDGSDALSNRFLVLPFKTSFAGREEVTLDATLDNELPGIFNWALDGLQRLWDTQAFTRSYEGEQELKAIRAFNNPVADFIDQCITFRKNKSVESDVIYNSFCEHMDECGRAAYSKQRFFAIFGPQAARKGVKKARRRGEGGVRFYYYEGMDLLVNPNDAFDVVLTDEDKALFD